MKFWRFMDYQTVAGVNLISVWYEGQTEKVKANFDAVLNELAGTRDWNGHRNFKVLGRQHTGLCEIKFSVDKSKYRPVGFFSDIPWQFILILGCEKSGRIYVPNSAFDMALNYRLDFLNGRGTICEHI